MTSGPITSWQIDGETMETVTDYFGGSKISADDDSVMKVKDGCSLEETNLDSILKSQDFVDQPRDHIKKQRHYFANKGLSSQSHGFSSSHVWM